MATVHVSPGAYFQTTDLSSYVPKLTESAYGVIGRFEKGPTTPTIINDPQTFVDVYGYPEIGQYSALSGLLYLENGSQLYVKRLTGQNSRIASADIPAGEVIQNEKIVTADGNDYQFHLSLDHTPIKGTVVLYVGNNVFYDNGQGKMLGNATSMYCNYLDYDSGLFRFTLAEAPEEGEKVSIRYNGKLFVINNEELGKTDGSAAFSGMFRRSGIYFPEEDSVITVSFGTRTVVGPVDPKNPLNADGMIELKSPADSTFDDRALVNPITGAITISFDSDSPVAEDTKILASYYVYKESSTVVGVGDGHTRAFSGYLQDRVSPGTSSIWVNDELVSEDIKSGDYIGTNLVYSDNSIDYTTGTIKLALTFEPDEGTVIYSTYSTKAESMLYVFDSPEKTASFTANVGVAPVVKGSVEIVCDQIHLVDDGEGYLMGDGGNGTIDYNTGDIHVNLAALPAIGTTVRCLYLAKYGEMRALYEGEYGNGIKGKFTYLPDTGYNFEVWTKDQNPNTDSPDEYWRNLELADTASSDYITTKVSSYSIVIVPSATDVYIEPLLGQVFETVDGQSDTENVTTNEVVSAINEFSNAENYDINLIACPDFPGDKTVANALIKVCEDRGDCFCIIDPPSGLTPRQAADWSNGESSWNFTTRFDSNFAAIYYPWVYVNNPLSGSNELCPPSVIIPSTYTYSDNMAYSWYAPAGANRGFVSRATGLERVVTLEERNLIYGYPNVINPIISIPGQGIVLWGQKTCQRRSTALDRIHVRRLVNYISKIMATAFMDLLFEPNDVVTWTKYKQIVQPILEEIQANRGLYECSVQCDASLNTSDVIERNEMHAKVFIQPMKTVEVIETNFILTGTGTTVEV